MLSFIKLLVLDINNHETLRFTDFKILEWRINNNQQSVYYYYCTVLLTAFKISGAGTSRSRNSPGKIPDYADRRDVTLYNGMNQ